MPQQMSKKEQLQYAPPAVTRPQTQSPTWSWNHKENPSPKIAAAFIVFSPIWDFFKCVLRRSL